MNYNRFKEAFKILEKPYIPSCGRRLEIDDQNYFGSDCIIDHYNKDLSLEDEDFIYSSVNIGGVSGGSCWDDSDPEPYYHNVNDYDFSKEKEIIKTIVKNISEKELNKLFDYNQFKYSVYEWYGNYDNYNVQYICLKELFEKLSSFEMCDFQFVVTDNKKVSKQFNSFKFAEKYYNRKVKEALKKYFIKDRADKCRIFLMVIGLNLKYSRNLEPTS